MAVTLLAHAKNLLHYASPPARASVPLELVGPFQHTDIFPRAVRVHFNLVRRQDERH